MVSSAPQPEPHRDPRRSPSPGSTDFAGPLRLDQVKLPALRSRGLVHPGAVQEGAVTSERLPILDHAAEILAAVERERAVVLTAPTGAGKSTEVPRLLMEQGYRVVVTEPRVLAARSLALRVAACRGEEVGNVVGYRTAHERADSRHSRITYCTDGLQLVRELVGHTHNRDVLIVDEFHERNLNQDVLLAWAKRTLEKDPAFKLIVMSATVDAERLSHYLGGAPVVHAPGRTFPIRHLPPGDSIEDDAEMLLSQGRNVLIFQPGKREIRQCIAALRARGVDAELLELHRDLTLAQQQACFSEYPRPKCVVATNIAEASITINDVDVIDSGQRRLIRTVGGVQGLYTEWISVAERDQRAGRAGRTRPGIAIDHCPLPDSAREQYPLPEISRLQLANAVLRVRASAKVGIEELSFLDSPPRAEIPAARRSLISLECFDGVGEVTDIGREVARLPVSVNLGRMLVEAAREGVLREAIAVAALIEVGGITQRDNPRWRAQFCPEEHRSDAMAQLAVLRGATELLEAGQSGQLLELGINLKNLVKAHESQRDLAERLGPPTHEVRRNGVRGALTRAFLAGFRDNVFVRVSSGWICAGHDEVRTLVADSVVARDERYLVGIPWDVSTELGSEGRTVHLIKWAIALDRKQVPDEVLKAEKEQGGRRREQTVRRRPIGRRGF